MLNNDSTRNTYSTSSISNWKQGIAAKFATFRSRHIIAKSPFQSALKELPPELFSHWQQVAPREFDGIPSDAVFFTLAAEGLMRFFHCVKRSERACGLPSKAADSVWHAWLSLPQQDLRAQSIDEFCLKHFGRLIPHVEAAVMRDEMAGALAVSLAYSREQEGKIRCEPHLPKLFALDRTLKMPRGYSYRRSGDRLGFQHMNIAGKPVGNLQYPASFSAHEFLALGLISQGAFDAYQDKMTRHANADAASSWGSSCGSSCSSSSHDSSGGHSAGDSGGSSCGSSCGSGCGGGCSS